MSWVKLCSSVRRRHSHTEWRLNLWSVAILMLNVEDLSSDAWPTPIKISAFFGQKVITRVRIISCRACLQYAPQFPPNIT